MDGSKAMWVRLRSNVHLFVCIAELVVLSPLSMVSFHEALRSGSRISWIITAVFHFSLLFAVISAWLRFRSVLVVHRIDVNFGARKARNSDRFDTWKEAMHAFYEEDRKESCPGSGCSAAFLNWLFSAPDGADNADNN